MANLTQIAQEKDEVAASAQQLGKAAQAFALTADFPAALALRGREEWQGDRTSRKTPVRPRLSADKAFPFPMRSDITPAR
jgi:hypothetical protein